MLTLVLGSLVLVTASNCRNLMVLSHNNTDHPVSKKPPLGAVFFLLLMKLRFKFRCTSCIPDLPNIRPDTYR